MVGWFIPSVVHCGGWGHLVGNWACLVYSLFTGFFV